MYIAYVVIPKFYKHRGLELWVFPAPPSPTFSKPIHINQICVYLQSRYNVCFKYISY